MGLARLASRTCAVLRSSRRFGLRLLRQLRRRLLALQQRDIFLFGRLARGADERDLGVRVGDGGQFEELVDAAAPSLVLAFELDGDARARGIVRGRQILALLRDFPHRRGQFAEPLEREVIRLFVERDLRSIRLRVHRQFDVVGVLRRLGAGLDEHGLAGRDQAVHARGRDADALLPAAHLEAVELGAVKQPPEDVFHLRADDARPVVHDGDAVAAALGRRGPPGLEVLDHDRDVGQNPRFLARVQRVVHGLLHRREQGLTRIVEAQQVAVLGEELGDRNVPLLARERFGGHGLLGFAGRRLG